MSEVTEDIDPCSPRLRDEAPAEASLRETSLSEASCSEISIQLSRFESRELRQLLSARETRRHGDLGGGALTP